MTKERGPWDVSTHSYYISIGEPDIFWNLRLVPDLSLLLLSGILNRVHTKGSKCCVSNLLELKQVLKVDLLALRDGRG